MPSSRAGGRSTLFDPADLDWRWNPILREARQRYSPPSGGGQSLQERHSGASLRGASTLRRVTEFHLTTACSGRRDAPPLILNVPKARVGLIDRSVECRLQVIMPQAEILLRCRNLYIADSHPPPARRWSKET